MLELTLTMPCSDKLSIFGLWSFIENMMPAAILARRYSGKKAAAVMTVKLVRLRASMTLNTTEERS